MALGFPLLNLASPYVEGVNLIQIQLPLPSSLRFEQSNIVWLSYWHSVMNSDCIVVVHFLTGCVVSEQMLLFFIFLLSIYYHVEIYTSCISIFLSFSFALQPVGVVGAITPWNFPLAMITRKVSSHAVYLFLGKLLKMKWWLRQYTFCIHGFWAGWTSFGLWLHCCCQAIRIHTSDSIGCSRPCSSSWNTSGNHIKISIIPILFEFLFLVVAY